MRTFYITYIIFYYHFLSTFDLFFHIIASTAIIIRETLYGGSLKKVICTSQRKIAISKKLKYTNFHLK